MTKNKGMPTILITSASLLLFHYHCCVGPSIHPGSFLGENQLVRLRAIDAANTSVCPEKDQIGQPRKPHCDIGAIEFSHHLDELVQNHP